VSEFSMGMRARLAVASCLLRSPALLVLDEPTSGLDPRAAAELLALLEVLADDGMCVLLSSHNLTAVAGLCDDVTVLVSGRVVTSGPMAALTELAPPPSYILATSADAVAVRVAKRTSGIRIEVEPERLIVRGTSDAMDTLVLALADEAIAVRRLEPHESPLRLLFDELTAPVQEPV
jgi:ABC-2 type transport system ATP-binding protein